MAPWAHSLPSAPKAPSGPPWVPLGSPYWVPWAQCPGKVGMTKLPLESLVEDQALPERVSQVGGTARECKELYFEPESCPLRDDFLAGNTSLIFDICYMFVFLSFFS